MSGLSEQLTRDYLARLEALVLESRKRLSGGGYAGMRRSTAKGGSVEFSDFREYVPGDDLRRIDWNGAARFDRLYIKLFLEERQLTVNVVLDTSASIGAAADKAAAQKLWAASLAFLTLKGADRLNLYACGGESKALEGVTSRQNLPRAVDFLDGLTYAGGTRLSESLQGLAGQLRPGGLTLVFSDFFSEDGVRDGLLALRKRRQDVVLVQVLGEEERRPALSGALRLVDAETKGAVDLELTPTVLAAYEENRRAYESQLATLCRELGAGFASPDGRDGPFLALRQILQAESRV